MPPLTVVGSAKMYATKVTDKVRQGPPVLSRGVWSSRKYNDVGSRSNGPASTLQSSWVAKLDVFMDSNIYLQFFLAVLLLSSLFLPDVWILGNVSSSHDMELNVLLVVIFICFAFEVVVLSLCHKGYFGSFFFWADVLGTASVLLDTPWIAGNIFLSSEVASGVLLRIARTAKVSARSSRLAKLTRLFRYVSIRRERGKMKARSAAQVVPVEAAPEPEATTYKRGSIGRRPRDSVTRRSNKTTEPQNAPAGGVGAGPSGGSSTEMATSKVSSILSKKIAALALLLVFVIPLLDPLRSFNSPQAWLDSFDTVAEPGQAEASLIAAQVEAFEGFYDDMDISPLSLSISGAAGGDWTFPPLRSIIREDNVLVFTSDLCRAEFDFTEIRMASSLSSLLTVLLVVVVLMGFSVSLNRVVERHVVEPVSRMLNSLKVSLSTISSNFKALDLFSHEEGEGPVHEEDEALDVLLESGHLEAAIERLASLIAHRVETSNTDGMTDLDNATKEWIGMTYMHGQTQGQGQPADGRKTILSSRVSEGVLSASGSKDFLSLSQRSSTGDLKAVIEANDKDGVVVKEISSFEIMLSSAEYREMQTWQFNPLRLKASKLIDTVLAMFQSRGVLDLYCTPETLARFMQEVQAGYLNNPYHNFLHAIDVCHACYRFIQICNCAQLLSTVDVFSLLVAAIGHDIGHFGLNNPYLVTTKHELALLHNDVSPLENMHCSTLYKVVRDKKADIFELMAADEWQESRKIIITCILGTDMSHHFSQINRATIFFDVNQEELASLHAGEEVAEELDTLSQPENKLFIMELFLHGADVSNPVKPFHVSQKWAYLIMEEFFAQGDKEREADLPISPMCDRNSVNIPMLQMNFLEFVVAPLYIQLACLFPPLDPLLDTLLENQKEWASKREYDLRKSMKRGPEADNSESEEQVLNLETRIKTLGAKLRPPAVDA